MTNRTRFLVLCLALSTAALVLVQEGAALVGMPFTPFSFAGVARRTTRRAVVFGAGAAEAAAVSSAAAAQPAPAPAPPPTPVFPTAPMPPGAPPIGTTVGTLPSGCVSSPMNDIAYKDCSGVYYRPAFQGNNLVYVVVEKP